MLSLIDYLFHPIIEPAHTFIKPAIYKHCIYCLIRFGYGFAIVMEDIGGVSIKQLIPTKGFSLSEFYPIALEIGMLYHPSDTFT